MHFFRLTDSIRQTYLHISYVNSEKSYSPLVLVFNANEIKIVEFIQESVFMHRKPCAAIESEFDVWIWKLYSLSSIPPLPATHTHTHTHTRTHFNFRTKQGPKISVSNIRDIAFYGCSEIIRTRIFTSFTMYITIFGQFIEDFF